MSKIHDYNDWLAYSIEPRQLRTALRPAMWGNGQLELLAELDRPCVSEVVCFDFQEEVSGILLPPAGSAARSIRCRQSTQLTPAINTSSIQPLHRPRGKSL